jgi:hypothetical protein
LYVPSGCPCAWRGGSFYSPGAAVSYLHAGDISFTPGDFHFQEYALPINMSGAVWVHAGAFALLWLRRFCSCFSGSMCTCQPRDRHAVWVCMWSAQHCLLPVNLGSSCRWRLGRRQPWPRACLTAQTPVLQFIKSPLTLSCACCACSRPRQPRGPRLVKRVGPDQCLRGLCADPGGHCLQE